MFENLIMLAGLGGAALPLVIHLLSRARYRTVPWGAMMLLEEPSAPSPRPYVGRLREAALLAVRMGIVGLLAIALARPVAGQLAAATTGAMQPAPVAAVIVIDCSASMSHEDAGGTRIALAQQAALRILSTLRRGDQVCLMEAGTSMQTPTFTGDLQSVATRMSELNAQAGSVDFVPVIRAAADALERQEGGEKRIYIVCDMQAQSWAGVDDEAAASLRARLKAAAARTVVVRVGSDDVENVAVESVEVLNPPAVAGCEAQIEVRMRNHGKQTRAAVPLVLRVGGRDALSATINLPAGQPVNFRGVLPLKVPAGLHAISAELRGGVDADDADNRMDKVIDVSKPIRTLIVRGEQRGGAPDYFVAALAPHAAAGRAGGDVAAVEVVARELWDPRNLAAFGVVVLDDVPAITADEARLLEQFVYGGGGLLIAPGAAARIEEYNRVLYREESGLLPALLQPSAAVQGQLQRIEPATFDTSHPLMAFLAGHAAGSGASVQRYLPITARTASARVLGSYSTGDPFVIESAFGAGKVVLITCALDAQWTALPLTNLYLPLVQSTVRYLARGNDPRMNVTAGDEIVATLSPPVDAARAVVLRPDGSRDSADATQLEERMEVRYGTTDMAGVYRVRMGTGANERSAIFAVSPPARESDLTSMDAVRWSSLTANLGFVNEQIAVSPARWAASGWLTALMGLLGLLALEMWLTCRWSFSSREPGGLS